MVDDAADAYFVRVEETFAGRKAGAGAREKARQHGEASPIRRLAVRLSRQHTDERAWRKGADGERFVGWLLGRLPDGWYVFHDVPVGERGANIDHVVIGPGGVFTINTKNLSAKIAVEGDVVLANRRRTDYIAKAAREAERASRLLSAALGHSVHVRGALAILANDVSIARQPQGVFVGRPRGVKRWILDQPGVLGPSEVLAIAGAAHKPSTWVSSRTR